MLRISLAPALPEGITLPQILCYDELETMDTMMWLGMQNVIIVNDRSSPNSYIAACSGQYNTPKLAELFCAALC